MGPVGKVEFARPVEDQVAANAGRRTINSYGAIDNDDRDRSKVYEGDSEGNRDCTRGDRREVRDSDQAR